MENMSTNNLRLHHLDGNEFQVLPSWSGLESRVTNKNKNVLKRTYLFVDWWSCKLHSRYESHMCYYKLKAPSCGKEGTDLSEPPCWGRCPFSDENCSDNCIPQHEGSSLYERARGEWFYIESYPGNNVAVSDKGEIFFPIHGVYTLFDFHVPDIANHVKIDHPRESVVKRALKNIP